MKPAFVLNGTAQYLPSYSAVSSVDGMNLSPFSEMSRETSSSQPWAAYSAVQITSMPSTSHSADLASQALDLQPALLVRGLGQLEQLDVRVRSSPC